MRQQQARDRQRTGAMVQRLDALSPLAVLGRGYAIALRQDGSAVRDAAEVSSGDPLEIRVWQGRIRATVD
jgi:exodeoxyribonuclease VII large subunit